MIEKKRVSYSLYVVLFILVMAAGLFLSGLFSFPDLALFNVSEKLEYLLKHFWEIKRYFNDNTILCLGVAFILWFFICSYVMYHYRDFHMDIENGSEEWGDAADITKRRANENNEQNRFISKNLKIDTQGKGRLSNNNMIIIASSGKYKTTSVVVQNLLKSLYSNKIFLDVKGELMFKYGLYLKKMGFDIRCLNLKNPEMSDRYNPFAYIECEEDIIKLIENIQQSVTPPDAMKGDPFWDDGVALYLQSVFYYEWYMAKKDGRTGTFNNVLKLVNDEAKYDTSVKVGKGEKPPTLLAQKMKKLAAQAGEDNPAVRDYRKLKEGASETVRSIIIITNAKLKLCETAALKRIFEEDDMCLRDFAYGVGGTLKKQTKKKMALFICVDDSDKSFNFVASMLYTQALTVLMRIADNEFRTNDGALPIPLEMWLDEFYAGARPANAVELLGTIRSRNISMIPILQSAQQLKDLYPGDKAEIIFDNIPVLFFGGAGQGALQTHKFISELTGNATFDSMSDGKHGNQFNGNYSKKGRELITPAEVKRMKKEDCIIFVEDERPVYDKKALPWEEHVKGGLSPFEQAMKLNKESPDEGYVPEQKSMIDPHTGNYVTIKHDKNTCTAEELPEGAKTADFTNEQFIYHKLGKNADEKTMEAAVSSEIKRLREIQKKIKRNMDAAVRKSSQPDNAGEKRNVTDSVTNRIPDTIEDGIVNYFDSLDEKARELINNAIENNMPDIFIRQMFTMDYESMKEFYEEYFK